jgi:diguanylate cyclase (GGDEF)-like protein
VVQWKSKIVLESHRNFLASMLHWIVPGRAESSVAQFGQNRRSIPVRIGSPKYLCVCLALLITYFLSGQFERFLLHSAAGVSALDIHAGLTWAALLLWGYGVWPATFVGLLVAHISPASSPLAALALAAIDVVAAAAGIYVIKKFAGGTNALTRVRHFLRLALATAVISAVASMVALVVVSLTIHSPAATANWLAWLTGWQAQFLGILIILPCAFAFLASSPVKLPPRRRMATLLCGLALGLLAICIFVDVVPFPASFVLGGVCFILLVTAPSQIEEREVAAGVLMMAVISLAGSLSGHGPFVRSGMKEPLLALRILLNLLSLLTLGISALVSEHRRSEEFLKKSRDELAAAAISDPLTGLSNYRHFIDVFNTEADRSRRTGRTFALVLFDLDDLKLLNDTNGHLSGTHAICRVGNTMRVYCRNIDTAVRYGGDEFALVLPETEEAGAQEVARRISLQIANDGGTPAISVSFGITTFPEGGASFEEVFGRADAALYEMKGRNKASQASYRKLG